MTTAGERRIYIFCGKNFTIWTFPVRDGSGDDYCVHLSYKLPIWGDEIYTPALPERQLENIELPIDFELSSIRHVTTEYYRRETPNTATTKNIDGLPTSHPLYITVTP